MDILSEINKAWNWTGIKAVEILAVNHFGNVLFIDSNSNYYKLILEDLALNQIAKTQQEFDKLKKDQDFIEDWEVNSWVNAAQAAFGKLDQDQKYCFKIPPVLGGEYSLENMGIKSFKESIAFSGDIAFQIKDIPDGQEIKLEIKN